MTLVLSIASRAELVAELLKPSPRGIFVPTTELQLAPGVTVQLVVQVSSEKLGTVVEARVLEAAPQGPGGKSGLYVSLSPEQQERCRGFLGLGPAATGAAARSEVRVDCQLPLRFSRPADARQFYTRNISNRGLLASCELPLAVGQQVRLEIDLGPGARLEASASVAWVRPELKLAGFSFQALTERDLLLLDTEVARLKQGGPAASEAPAPGAASPGRPDVVLADDEPAVLAFISRALAKSGFKVLAFERGDEGLKAIRAQRPRLVMLDVLMPGVDGLQVCSLIKADAMLAGTPVVLLSGLEREKIRRIAEEANATAWLQKPIALTDLRSLVNKLLGAREQGPE